MNRTKLIYFLSAFVLIIGCLILNQSYSMFVQTETINNVDATIPTLAYSLGDNNLTTESFNIPANSDELLKIKINNLGTVDIKFVVSLLEKVDGVNVQLIELDNNIIIGNLTSQNSKYIWFKVNNTTMEDKEVKFSIFATYYTINIENEEILANTNIDTENLYKINLKDTIIINAINAKLDKTLIDNSIYVEDKTTLEEKNYRGLLLNIEDDYTETTGTVSYYFNGDVKDNYLNFANMCFRIVRIESDGSIKLILEDIDNICEESNGNFSLPLEIISSEEKKQENTTEEMQVDITNKVEENIEEDKKIIYNGSYGYNKKLNEQIILEYLNPANNNSMANEFKKFQDSFNEYLSYMKADNWCIEKTLYDDETGTNIVNDINLNYNSWKKMYYKAYADIKNNNITLKCNDPLINSFNDGTPMYVSTLTASEIILAGIKENDYKTNYLMNDYSLARTEEENNYKGINFWTLTPAYFDGLRSYAYVVNSNGNLVKTDLLSTDITFRPSIVLKNDIGIIRGNGSKSNPYIIIEDKIEESIS